MESVFLYNGKDEICVAHRLNKAWARDETREKESDKKILVDGVRFEEASPVEYHDLKPTSKPTMVKLSEINYGPWMEQDEAVDTCWKKPTLMEKQQSGGYIVFSLTYGPEYHASQVANTVLIARKLGATLTLPDIIGKSGMKRSFSEVYDVDNFLASLHGVVRVEKTVPDELANGRLPIIRVPNQASEEFISSTIGPVYLSKRNLTIVTYFASPDNAKGSGQQSNTYQCLAMFESLRLQPRLQELADSMVWILRSLSSKMGGRFLAVDFQADCLDRCLGPQDIGIFIERIGFHPNTTVYLTQTGWHPSLDDSMRSIFPNTFTKDAIMPSDEKVKLMEVRSRGLERYIDFYMCVQADVFVPGTLGRFYDSVVGERIWLGKTRIFVPAMRASDVAADYASPYVAEKSHFAYSCLC